MIYRSLIFLFFSCVTLTTQGQEARNNNRIDSLRVELERAKTDSAKLSINYRIARRIYIYAPDSAALHANAAAQLAQKINVPYMEAKAYQQLGVIQKNKGDFERALELQLKALPLLEKSNFPGDYASNLNDVGVLYKTMGEFEKALPYYKKSLTICIENNYKNPTAMLLNNVGTVHDGLGQRDSAMIYYKMALDTALKYDLVMAKALSYNNIGEIYGITGKHDSSIKYMLLTLKLDRQTGNKYGSVNTYMNLGSSYMLSKKYQRAELYLDSAQNAAKELGAKNLLKSILYVKHELYKRMELYKQALSYMEQYSELSDSIMNESKIEQMADMEAKYETAQKEKELAVAQKEKADLALEAEHKSKLAYGFGFGGLIVLGLTSFIFIRRRQLLKAKMQEAIIQEKENGLKAVIEATDNERKRIAKELHDGIAQTLSGLKLGFDSVQDHLNFNTEAVKNKYKESLNYLQAACDEVRTISHEMMPKTLSENGLVDSIDDMLNRSLGNTQIQYSFESFGISKHERFANNIELSVYRISQEMVNNVIKHANASEVNVQLVKGESHLLLLVEDDGKGFDYHVISQEGIGLMNIKSRVSTIQGEVSFEQGPSRGTVATVRIPLQNTLPTD